MIKYKHIVIVAVIAVLFYIFGALFKILHWAFPLGENSHFGGPELIVISVMFWAIAGGLLIFKAITARGNDFLNR
ncbi:hypothetical protein [Nonlabens sp.]|uniref:hypothetical protein n=1 Tax=Nonlabens sp. TaxID=1888209 RepID=UPI00326556EA